MRRFISGYLAALRSPLPYMLWAALTVLLTVSGPFDTYDTLTWPERAVYWALVVALSLGIGKAVRVLVDLAAGHRHLALRMALVSTGIAGALGPVVWLLSRTMVGPTVPPLTTFLGFVFVIAVTIQILRCVVALAHRPAPAATASGMTPPGLPRLLDRIEPALRGDILRLSARNHYVEVQTDKGQADLLLRFSDALAEVEALDGAQVHRSHWIAWSIVDSAFEEGNRLFLNLVDGGRIPVSRRHEALLIGRGLL